MLKKIIREYILNLMGIELSKEESSIDKKTEANKDEDKKEIINPDLSEIVKLDNKDDLYLYNDLNKEYDYIESNESKESSSEKIVKENETKKTSINIKEPGEAPEGFEIIKDHNLENNRNENINPKKIIIKNLDEIPEKFIENKGDNSFIFNGKMFKKDKRLSNYIKKNNIIREVYKCEYCRHEEKLRQELKLKSFCNATIEYILPN